MLPTRDDAGRAISPEEEKRLLVACGSSRSRSLLTAVTLALHTGMRYGEIRSLRWGQIDLNGRRLVVGKSKTAAGTGRPIPLNDRATATLLFWAGQFPQRKPEHYVFPAERYGAAGDKFEPCVYATDVTSPTIDFRISNAIDWRHPGRGCLHQTAGLAGIAGSASSKSRGVAHAEAVAS